MAFPPPFSRPSTQGCIPNLTRSWRKHTRARAKSTRSWRGHAPTHSLCGHSSGISASHGGHTHGGHAHTTRGPPITRRGHTPPSRGHTAGWAASHHWATPTIRLRLCGRRNWKVIDGNEETEVGIESDYNNSVAVFAALCRH